MLGYVLKSGGTNTSIIYISQTLMNRIPRWAGTYFSTKRALNPSKIRKFIEKELQNKSELPVWKQDGDI